MIEYTLNADAGTPDWQAFNEGNALAGGQSRFVRVTTGVKINVRSKEAGKIVRAIVGSP